MSETSIVNFRNVSFAYEGGTSALNGLTLSIPRGQLVGIIGGNGSGKSTFARHVSALLVPDDGTASVLGHDTREAHAARLIRPHVGMVFQNPDDQLVASLVEDEVAFGPENLGVVRGELRERVDEALCACGLSECIGRDTHTLSGGQKQRVAIAGALTMSPDLLVLDEATSMLDPQGRTELMDTLTRLHASGMTIIMITHFMDEAAACERVIALDGGAVALDGTPTEVLSQVDALATMGLEAPVPCRVAQALRSCGVDMPPCLNADEFAKNVAHLHHEKSAPAAAQPRNVQPDRAHRQAQPAQTTQQGELAQQAHVKETPRTEEPPKPAPQPFVVLENVSFTYDDASRRGSRGRQSRRGKRKHGDGDASPTAPASDASGKGGSGQPAFRWALRDVNLEIAPGEVIGIAGRTGSGKSTLVKHLNGLLHPACGRVLVGGRDLAEKHLPASARLRVGMAFQYPESQLFASTVFDDVAFGPRNLGLSPAEVKGRVCEALETTGLDFDQIARRSPFALSGGQQRCVALAGVLATRPEVLVLDEPASGLDPAARTRLLALIGQLRAQGVAVVMVSHSTDDLARVAERLIVLDQGEVVLAGTPAEIFSASADLTRCGLNPPAAQALVQRLRQEGIGLPHTLYDERTLTDALENALGGT